MSENLNTELKEFKPLIFETMLKIVSGQIPVKSIEFKVNTALPKSDVEKQLSDLKEKLNEYTKKMQESFPYDMDFIQDIHNELFGTETEVKDV